MILAVLITLAVLLTTYSSLMMVYRRGWRLQQSFALPSGYVPVTKISIIIPARNEEQHIGECINSILANNYPDELYEIIVIDDHSADNTFNIVEGYKRFNVKCLRLSDYLKEGEVLNAYKKKAITIGIEHSSGELIITTDADCITQKNWLRNIAAIYEEQEAVMIIGTVKFTTDKSILSVFQSLDFMSMQGITAAAHRLKLGNMSNGANLAFSKAAFTEVNGYDDVTHLASGDDYLLLVKMGHKFPGRIAYLRSSESIVSTTPQPGWTTFLNQRIRWASKMGKYDDKVITIILLLVYLFNLSFLVLFAAGFYDPYFWILGLSIMLIKTAVELFYLRDVAVFFGKERELSYFPFLQPLHILYIILAGFLGFFWSYNWKGRRVK